jgi:tetratricopeptide (TPR) repeat protein
MNSSGLRRSAWLAAGFAAGCFALTSASLAQTPPSRVAMVISGSASDASAAELTADADAMVRVLGSQGLGYEVLEERNAGVNRLWEAKSKLEARVRSGGIVIIYYAGYGVRVGDVDYLVPAGAALASTDDVANQGFNLDNLVRGARERGAEVVVLLDACRKKPQWEAVGVQCLGSGVLQRDQVYVLAARSAPAAGEAGPSAFTAALTRQLQRGATIRKAAAGLKTAVGAVSIDLPIAPDQDPLLSPPLQQATAVAPAPVQKPAVPAVDTASLNANPASTLAGQSPALPSAASADLSGAGPRLNEATTLFDNGDIRGARARIAGLRPALDAARAASPQDYSLHILAGRAAMIEGDYDGAIAAFGAARARLPEGGSPGLNFNEGTAYLRAGRWAEALRLLDGARGAFPQESPNYYAGNAKIQARRGEALRQLGRREEAKAALADSKVFERDVDNAAAAMQGALLALSENDYPTASSRAREAIAYRESTPGKVGLAEAIAVLGRAELGLRPTDEATAWMFADKALQTDPSDRTAVEYVTWLGRNHARMLPPPFKSMAPRQHPFDLAVEDRAMTCYPSTIERDAYLQQDVTRENTAIRTYVDAINAYLTSLNELDGRYQAKGYNYHDAIIAEFDAWKARAEGAGKRSKALIAWFDIAKLAKVCDGDTPLRMPRPSYYNPAIPPVVKDPPPIPMRTAAPSPILPDGPAPSFAANAAPPPAAQPAAAKPGPSLSAPVQMAASSVPRPTPASLVTASPPASPLAEPPANAGPTISKPEPAKVASPPPVLVAANTDPPAKSAPEPVKAPPPAAKPPVNGEPEPAVAALKPGSKAVKPKTAAPPGEAGPTLAQTLAKAEAFLVQDNADQALVEFTRAAETDAASVDAQSGVLLAKGLIRLRGNDVQGAMDTLDASVKQKPRPQALEALGRIYSVNGNRGAAVDAYTQALSLNPKSHQALFGRAEARLARSVQLREFSEAKLIADDYRAAIALRGSDFAEGWNGLGAIQFYTGDYAGAVESLTKALAARRIYPEALYARARAKYELGNYMDSLRDLGDLGDQYEPYARACAIGLNYVAIADDAVRAKDDPKAVENYKNAQTQFKLAVTFRGGTDRMATNQALTMGSFLAPVVGKTVRMGRAQLVHRKPGVVAPTATLLPLEACRTS